MKKAFALILVLSFVYSCSSPKKEEPVEQSEPTLKLQMPAQVEPQQEESERTEWQNPELVISLLGDLKGKTVADIGAGSGYFSFKIAKEAQKVIALEVDPNALEYIEDQKKAVGNWASNIEARLTPPDVPNLLPEEVDKVLIVNTYTFLPDKVKYLVRLRDGMKDGADLVIVDFKQGDIPVGPSDTFKESPSEIIAALRAINLREITVDVDKLEYQYIITAKK